MEFGATFFAVAIPAVLFAGISKGGFASGAAFAATPILALVIPPGFALGMMLPLLMLMDVAMLRPYWRKWDPEGARLLIIGGIPGVALGAALWQLVPAAGMKLLIGLVALGFVVFQLARALQWLRLRARPVGPLAGLVAGVAAGFTSFVSHAGGPPAAVYLLLKGVAKTPYQATTVIVFWIINILKFIPFIFLDIFNTQTALASLMLAPVALIGAWIGVHAHHRIPERAFFAVTYVLLAATGAKLIWDALI